MSTPAESRTIGRAEHSVSGKTLIDHVLYRDSRNGALNVDVVVVDRCRKVGQEARAKDHAKAERIGNLRLQIRDYRASR